MVGAFNSWAQKIVVVVLICTIIEMILPEGKNKNYIKAVIGLYVVFTIISPIVSKINNNSFEISNFLELEKENNLVAPTVSIIDTKEYIKNVYIDKMKTDMEEKLLDAGYTVKTIDLEIETKNENKYGNILYIKVYLEKYNEEEINNIEISKITIGENKKSTSNISETEKTNIKKYLSEIYGLDLERIEVM